jgi:peptidoglycan/LPS O-acetylase OafA/YrhL
VATSTPTRLVEVDALRGVAALAVVLFHYTWRFGELFPGHYQPAFSFSTGYYGVNLFFIISGFVIFMTLERTQRPMDFVVSRFSRLFPSFWVAIGLTFALTHMLGLPGKLVDVGTALANVVMVHSIFKVPHVDDVYWTLEVEMLFYCGMFTLYRLKRLGSIHLALFALLLLRLVYFVVEHHFGLSLPWMIYRLMILQYIPWFTLGICVYLAVNPHKTGTRMPAARTAIMAIGTLFVCESASVAGLAVAFATAVWLASSGRFGPLRLRPFVWLGTISYPLYLLHENIGWSIMLRLLSTGLNINLAIAVTLVLVLLLASAVTRWVEQPAMRWIRTSYKQRTAQKAP